MKTDRLILKFDGHFVSDAYSLNRLVGWIPAKSVLQLISSADLKANPREAKVGAVTDEIQESLDKSADIFHFKTKGVLIAAGSCRKLERGRFELGFEDHEIEGVLDGGHNLLASGLYLARELADEEHQKPLRRVKTWEDLEAAWEDLGIDRNPDEVPNFLLPVEVIYPQEDAEGRDAFEHAILDVARARNNNAQLTLETKANKAGYYDFLKECLDESVAKEVEWKTNDGGRIKSRDIVSLAWVPLSRLNLEHLIGGSDFNPVNIYRNKGACTSMFNKVMETDTITMKRKGEVRELHNDTVKSALSLMKDLPWLYDVIYQEFPEAYNQASSGFGRIGSVRLFEQGKYKKGEKKYLKAKPLTRFYKKECKYDYPDGFIMPIVWALRELVEVEGTDVRWKVDPEKFVREVLPKTLSVYYGFVQMANYDPQKVGKALASYQMVSNDFQSRLATATRSS